MVESFRHKGLDRFYSTGSTGGINPLQAATLRRQLSVLAVSTMPDGMAMPGWRLHCLKGNRSGEWSVWVSGNLRLVFAFAEGNAAGVDYEDYH